MVGPKLPHVITSFPPLFTFMIIVGQLTLCGFSSSSLSRSNQAEANAVLLSPEIFWERL